MTITHPSQKLYFQLHFHFSLKERGDLHILAGSAVAAEEVLFIASSWTSSYNSSRPALLYFPCTKWNHRLSAQKVYFKIKGTWNEEDRKWSLCEEVHCTSSLWKQTAGCLWQIWGFFLMEMYSEDLNPWTCHSPVLWSLRGVYMGAINRKEIAQK